MTKSRFLGPKRRNSPFLGGTLWQSNDYCSEDCFTSTYQISCYSDSKAYDFYYCFFALRDDFRHEWESRKAMAVCFTSKCVFMDSIFSFSERELDNDLLKGMKQWKTRHWEWKSRKREKGATDESPSLSDVFPRFWQCLC